MGDLTPPPLPLGAYVINGRPHCRMEQNVMLTVSIVDTVVENEAEVCSFLRPAGARSPIDALVTLSSTTLTRTSPRDVMVKLSAVGQGTDHTVSRRAALGHWRRCTIVLSSPILALSTGRACNT